MSNVPKSNTYIPALEFHWATPLYDFFIARTMPERRVKQWIVTHLSATLPPNPQIADVGAGTGTLAALLAKSYPAGTIHGFDADAAILQIASRKCQALTNIRFTRAFADALPRPDNTLDAVTSSLVFHHLATDVKLAAMREIARILKPGALFLLADFGPPHTPLMRAVTVPWRLLHHDPRLDDNVTGKLPTMLEAAGLVDVRTPAAFKTAFGSWVIYTARKPA